MLFDNKLQRKRNEPLLELTAFVSIFQKIKAKYSLYRVRMMKM